MSIGLKGAWKGTKGAKLSFRIKQLFWEIRYAWQRAWRGYDFVDVFDLGFVFARKMPILLKKFKENNIAMWYDVEEQKQLTEEETDKVLDEMIYYFENCDEMVVYDRILGEDWADKMLKDEIDWKPAYKELERCRTEALRLFSKWCFALWY